MGKKNYCLQPEDISPILVNWRESGGCIASDRITVDGCEIGYMYREDPTSNVPDSGWRFFAGDEDEAYINSAEKTGVYHLNTICNFDPKIIKFLHSPSGSAFFKDEKGEFRHERLQDRRK